MRRSAPGATSSEREGRSPGYCCCSIEDNGNHNALSRLSCVGPAAAREGGKGGRARAREGVGGAARLGRIGSAAARKASDGQGGGECEEGGVAARLAHGSDGGERQWI